MALVTRLGKFLEEKRKGKQLDHELASELAAFKAIAALHIDRYDMHDVVKGIREKAGWFSGQKPLWRLDALVGGAVDAMRKDDNVINLRAIVEYTAHIENSYLSKVGLNNVLQLCVAEYGLTAKELSSVLSIYSEDDQIKIMHAPFVEIAESELLIPCAVQRMRALQHMLDTGAVNIERIVIEDLLFTSLVSDALAYPEDKDSLLPVLSWMVRNGANFDALLFESEGKGDAEGVCSLRELQRKTAPRDNAPCRPSTYMFRG